METEKVSYTITDGHGGFGNAFMYIGVESFPEGLPIERDNVIDDDSQVGDGSIGHAHFFVSIDGLYVAYTSSSENLVPGDTNNTNDVFLRDRLDRNSIRVNVSNIETQGNSLSYSGMILPDTQFVAFMSYACNLVSSGNSNSSPAVSLINKSGYTGCNKQIHRGVPGID